MLKVLNHSANWNHENTTIVFNFVISTLITNGQKYHCVPDFTFHNFYEPFAPQNSQCLHVYTSLSPYDFARCKYNLYRKCTCKCKATVAYNSRSYVLLNIKHPIVGPRSAFESILYALVGNTFGMWKKVKRY